VYEKKDDLVFRERRDKREILFEVRTPAPGIFIEE